MKGGDNNMKWVHIIAYILLFVGGLNWGLVGLFNFNVVNSILGGMPPVENLVYVLVGVATVYIIATHRTDCRVCSGKK